MCEGVTALREILEIALRGGATKGQLEDLVGKIKSTLGKDSVTTKTGVGGSVYELATLIKNIDKGYELSDPKDVGDNVYVKEGDTRVRQQKWATGKKALTSNLSSALSQLSGTVTGNKEFAPSGSIAIADIVLTNPPLDLLATFQTEIGMRDYCSQIVKSALEKDDSKLGAVKSVSIRIIALNGGESTKFCADLTRDGVTVRPPSTKSRDKILLAEGLITLLGKDVDTYTRSVVSAKVWKLREFVVKWTK